MTSIKRNVLALLLISLGAGVAGTFIMHVTANAQGQSGAITGYAWSDTIGWISLNGSGYGLLIDTDGKLSGYAWSDNVGWVSANESELAGCPQNPCRAKLQESNLNGWLKALAGGSSQSGGWEGWISLSGSSPNYGVTKNPDGTFTGYAWGSDVVGWVDFSFAQTNYAICAPSTAYTCTGADNNTIRRTDTDAYCEDTITDGPTCISPEFCSVGAATCLYDPIGFVPSSGGGANDFTGHLEVRPSLVPRGATTKVYWNVENVESCTVEGTNGQSWTGASSASGGEVTGAINQRTTFTLSCTGGGETSITESASVNIVPVFQEN